MDTAIESERDSKLMAALLQWRRDAAAKFAVPVFYILQEKTLRLIVSKKPVTLEGLLHIDGIAEVKMSYFGPEILEVVEAHLFPGEKAVKDYAAAVPVKSCCHVCHASAPITCPGCGVVHSNPHTNWSTTTALLHQIKSEGKRESGDDLKKRKVKTAAEFVTANEDELHCPLNAIKKQKLMTPIELEKDIRIDPKSVEVQNAFLKEMAQQEMQKGHLLKKTPKRQKPASPNSSTSRRSSDASASKKNATVSNKSTEKDPKPAAKKRKRSRKRRRRKNTMQGSDKCKSQPKESDDASSVHLNQSFWEKASKVKKRAREALKKKALPNKKPKCSSKASLPNWIGTPPMPPSQPVSDDSVLFEEPPKFDSCSVSALKKFLSQNGFTCPSDIVDASELRTLAKNALPSWETRRVIHCERLPVPHRHRAILRLRPTDNADRMRSHFRKLSLLLHPDKNCLPEASHAFYLLQAAVQYLSVEFKQRAV